MATVINHIRPRKGTKRAAAANLEAAKQFEQLFRSFGATNSTYNSGNPVFCLELATKYGRLELTTFREEQADSDDCLWIYGRFLDDIAASQAVAEAMGINRHSGKWNHYILLDSATVQSKLDYYRNALTTLTTPAPTH